MAKKKRSETILRADDKECSKRIAKLVQVVPMWDTSSVFGKASAKELERIRKEKRKILIELDSIRRKKAADKEKERQADLKKREAARRAAAKTKTPRKKTR